MKTPRAGFRTSVYRRLMTDGKSKNAYMSTESAWRREALRSRRGVGATAEPSYRLARGVLIGCSAACANVAVGRSGTAVANRARSAALYSSSNRISSTVASDTPDRRRSTSSRNVAGSMKPSVSLRVTTT